QDDEDEEERGLEEEEGPHLEVREDGERVNDEPPGALVKECAEEGDDDERRLEAARRRHEEQQVRERHDEDAHREAIGWRERAEGSGPASWGASAPTPAAAPPDRSRARGGSRR